MSVSRLERPLRRYPLPLFLPLLAVTVLGWSGICLAIDLPPLRSEAPPQFTADVVVSLDVAGRPALSVSVTVPYVELQWIRTDSGYAAGSQITVAFEPRGGRRQYGDVWERRLIVKEFETTLSPVTAVVERRTFDLPAGRYEMRLMVVDLNSEQTSRAAEQITVPDYSRVPVGFVELELGVLRADQFHPVPTRRYGLDVRQLAGRVTLFDRRPGDWPRTYPFSYRILDESGAEVRAGRRESTLERSGAPVVIVPDSSDLFVGTYTLEVELVEGKSRWRVERGFEVEESGPPRGREFARVLEPLAFIAEPEEIDHLRALPPEEQERGWEEFWKRRDPTPETARNEALLEFMRRLRYVEHNFQNFGPGWRSDMGRVYIRYGTPDQVESRPATSQTPALEVWHYNQPYRRFVFADREGFGRFVLVSPALD